jgi:hypothetical protein
MSQSARVTSIDAVKTFKESLCNFNEQARDALCAVEMESRRVLDWLLYEAPHRWERELRQGEKDLAEAKADLHRIQLQRSSGAKVDDIEQKKALQRAKDRIEEAEEKLKKVKHWGRVAQRASEEYLGRARRLADRVEGDPPASVVFMEKVIAALDAYLKVAPPPGTTDRPVSVPTAANRASVAPAPATAPGVTP